MSSYQLSAFADEADKLVVGQFAAMRRNNIARIEVRGVNGKNVSVLSDEEAKELKNMLDGEGYTLSSMGSPFGKYPIEADFAEHRDAFKRGLEICHLLDTKSIRMFSFHTPKDSDPAEWRNKVLDQLNEMLDLAKDAGVKLCHENEKGIYGDTDDRCVDLMEQLGDRMGCIFDPANFIQCGVRPIEAYPRLKQYITYMHIKDAMLDGGAVVPSGKGDGCIPQILDDLSDKADNLILTLEPHLKVFDGLQGLQDEKLAHVYQYPSSNDAFDAAVSALKEVLTGIGYSEEEGGKGIWKR